MQAPRLRAEGETKRGAYSMAFEHRLGRGPHARSEASTSGRAARDYAGAAQNALRLQRNGLGVVAQVQDTSPESLKKLFTTATTSTWIQQNLTKMQTIFSKDESDKPSVGYIEGLL